ncbi:MAG: hypothetical protein Q4A05_06310, partial [Ruminococcus sp.]|nr:hypothetical protein [Ruminococcus sp.]
NGRARFARSLASSLTLLGMVDVSASVSDLWRDNVGDGVLDVPFRVPFLTETIVGAHPRVRPFICDDVPSV